MILTVDIGNTTIALALFRCTTKEPIFVEHIESNCSLAVLPYSEWIAATLKKHNVNPTHIQGAVLSSVVPPLTQTLCDAIIKVIGISTYVINARTDAGLTIKNYDVSTLGSDRIVDAVSAMLQWAPPLVVLDLGTATTVSVIDSDGGFIGGLIMPGPTIGIKALSSKTAQLPAIDFKQMAPTNIIGQDTKTCLCNGAIIGTAAAIDGIISRVENELGAPVTVVATGGHCKQILPWCYKQIQYEEHLLLKGLYHIYHNQTQKDC